MTILGIDPGRDKSGVAVIDGEGRERFLKTVPTEKLAKYTKALVERYNVQKIALGNGTTSKAALEVLAEFQDKIQLVDEYNTTQEAKKEFLRRNPPKGLLGLLPEGMVPVNRPVDNLVALILAKKLQE